ncbi:STAS domain-containing protein [Micromonospora mirobrigensis]|uniref:Anti-sigma factor antagonist n=1 Tax=Micromonospora mirobrigensis TaxID=262898 RepID=A0A1C4WAP5_9ACTN|nr:STAS domain-containing protein [Micromonospora mirobrigensis]SCE93253.1 anti-anti-sigma factor [Micromonospora mirobrigensis]
MLNGDPTWQHRLLAEQDHTVLALSGEIDVNGAGQLLDLLLHATARSARVDVDLQAVEFIDSTVISALITAHRTALAAGRQLAVVNPTGHVARTLRITGVLAALSGDRENQSSTEAPAGDKGGSPSR